MRTVGVFVLVIAVAVAGCSSKRASYAERADAVCAREQRAIARLPAALSAGVFERRLAIGRRELTELRALGPPAERARDARRFLGAMQREVEAAEQLRVASLTSDSESAQGAIYQGRQAAGLARLSAQSLGLHVCAAR